MALARKLHIDIAVKLHAYRLTGLKCRQRGQRTPGIPLCLLAAKASSHARRLYHYFVTWQGQHVGHGCLDLGRMLGGGCDKHRILFAALSPGRV